MDEVNLFDYIRILTRRWKVVACVTTLCLLVCGGVLVMSPRVYKAEAVLIFPLQKGDSLAGQLAQLTSLPLPIGGEYGSNPSLYTIILKSRTINQRVLQESGLPRDIVKCKDMQEQLGVQLSKDGSLAVSFNVPSSWAPKGSRSQRDRQSAQLAARVANLYVRELQDFDSKNSAAMGKSNREFIEGELAKTKAELAKAEVRLQRFRERNPTVAPPEATGKEFEQILELKTRQVEAESSLRETQNQVDSVRTALEDESTTITSSEVITANPVVDRLKQNLADLEVRRDTTLEKFTAEHPDVVDMDEQISKTQARIKEEIGRLVSTETKSVNPVRQQLQEQLVTAEAARSGLEARALALSALMDRAEQSLSSQPAVQIRQMRLLRDLKALDALYVTLLGEHGKSRVNEAREYKGFTVLDWAEVPKKRSKPNFKLSLLAAIFLGVTAGSMLALVQESMYRRTPKGSLYKQ